ncbi:hypothetical protein NDU88_010722 [Pleurodeles waltl]|uniref:Uncharacterized protein n=1 Tax=Pleurodeles waltl TaxID=8319 RepID=A0AAV7Q103_PLEWA|nr:hypothetical protein NDU88_010722 [Pleurodeles waltl]
MDRILCPEVMRWQMKQLRMQPDVHPKGAARPAGPHKLLCDPSRVVVPSGSVNLRFAASFSSLPLAAALFFLPEALRGRRMPPAAAPWSSGAPAAHRRRRCCEVPLRSSPTHTSLLRPLAGCSLGRAAQLFPAVPGPSTVLLPLPLGTWTPWAQGAASLPGRSTLSIQRLWRRSSLSSGTPSSG